MGKDRDGDLSEGRKKDIDYFTAVGEKVVKIYTDLNDPTTLNKMRELKASLERLGLNKDTEDAVKTIIQTFNQAITKIDLPIAQIEFLRKNMPEIMDFEIGNRKYFKNLYERMPSKSQIKLVKDEQQEKLVPMVRTTVGDEYSLSSQPFVESVPKIFQSINDSDTINFLSFLENYPFLAMENSIGKRIYQELELMAERICITIPDHTEFFRCRKWGNGQITSYTDSDMFAPYRAITKAARFNNFGVSHLYLASSQETAKYEIGRCKKFNTIRVKNRNSLRVLNLTPEMNVIFNYCVHPQRDKAIFPREYLIPNFISQCCAFLNQTELHQIDGIRYPSTKNPSEYSFVLFNKSKDSFVDIRLV